MAFSSVVQLRNTCRAAPLSKTLAAKVLLTKVGKGMLQVFRPDNVPRLNSISWNDGGKIGWVTNVN